MQSFFDLLKYAKTGIASPDMTAYDKMRALAAFGGKTQTLTGIPPLSFKANGKPLISWSMKGSGQQSGTPTPDAPIQPTFCGVRTGNLFDAATSVPGLIGNDGNVGSSSAYSTSEFIRVNDKFVISLLSAYTLSLRLIKCGYYTENKQHIANESSSAFQDGYKELPITPPDGTAYIRFSFISRAGYEDSNIMLNLGSTAQPYEPFGYKIPITCGGQTTPVYLGQVSTVRRVKKLVLTGDENGWTKGTYAFYLILSNASTYKPVICTHYPYYDGASSGAPVNSISTGSSEGSAIWIVTENHADKSLTDWKSYLAQQYAAGTPVTVWYVLATPETAIVNEPLAKIGDYCDELSSTDAGVSIPTTKGANVLIVDGDLQPSSMTITYT